MTALEIPGLPFPLRPEGQPPCEHRVDDGALILTSAPGTDLFADPAGGQPLPDAGRLLGVPPDGDFTLSARVTVCFRETYCACVRLLRAGGRRWATRCFRLSPRALPSAVNAGAPGAPGRS